MLNLSSNINDVKGIGPARTKLFHNLGIETVEDALLHFPRDYLDLSPMKFDQGHMDRIGAFPCIVTGACGEKRAKSGAHYVVVPISDGYNVGRAIFFNQRYIAKVLHNGDRLVIIGRIKKTSSFYEFLSPKWIKISGDKSIDIDSITPVYALTEGLTQNILRKTIKGILNSINPLNDIMPKSVKEKYNLTDYDVVIRNLHYPKNYEMLRKAQCSYAFRELLIFQLMLGLKRRHEKCSKRKNIYKDLDISEFLGMLPFSLTSGQESATNDLLQDLKSDRNMYRLIQGDVGSGKTIVACLALYLAAKNNFQGAMMVPTEILAIQHYDTLKNLLGPLNFKVGLLKGGMGKGLRSKILKELQEGKTDVIVGTHALLQEDVRFRNLGMVITDEQHRFGVNQRGDLMQKSEYPDTLVMSATPIPRTIALTLYRDLDISIMAKLPEGRQRVETHIVNTEMRRRVYDFMAKEVAKGNQAFVICPLVEDRELDLAAVEDLTKTLRINYPGIFFEMLYGNMNLKEKEKVLYNFMSGDINVLVSTTVVEVGVDVPRATMMIVENAERFGLAQLHQIRGRVGRGYRKSYCVLISDCEQKDAQMRLNYLKNCHDGFEIAQKDLELRGPGEFMGVKQHGFFDFKMAEFLRDTKTLEKTKLLSDEILEKGCLAHPEYEGLCEEIIDI